MVVQRMMVCCAKLNNEGAVHLGNGRYEDAVQSFTASLQLVKSSITTLSAQSGSPVAAAAAPLSPSSPSLSLPPHHAQVVISPLYELVQADFSSEKMMLLSPSSFSSSPLSLYRSPLRISDVANFEHNDPTVEASIAVIFNLALTYHLKALSLASNDDEGEDRHQVEKQKVQESPSLNENSSSSTTTTTTTTNKSSVALYQAATLYELAYNIQMQERLELHAEFTMAMINNLGHVYRSRGNIDKSDECFRYLLSTHLFLQSYGRTDCMRTDEFIASVSHLILKDSTAPAA
jgi:tetratricopeptide (TPR) repeat protein